MTKDDYNICLCGFNALHSVQLKVFTKKRFNCTFSYAPTNLIYLIAHTVAYSYFITPYQGTTDKEADCHNNDFHQVSGLTYMYTGFKVDR